MTRSRASKAMTWDDLRSLPRGNEIADAALGISPKPEPVARRGVMNLLEQRYAAELESQRRTGLITRWEFERIKLRVGAGVGGKHAGWYVPDFAVWCHARLDFHETKGYRWREQMAKLKAAADLYPEHRFALVEFDGSWRIQWLR